MAGLVGVDLVPPLSHRQEVVGEPKDARHLQVGRALGWDGVPSPAGPNCARV